MSQLALPLAWPADPRDDGFLVGPSNARAVELLEHPASWPVRAAILAGPPRSGRSLLARLWAARTGGHVIDDAQGEPEATLFHAWNAAQAGGRPLLLIADALTPVWSPALPDLRSRLGASVAAEIGPPDDALIQALLARDLARRGLDARPDLLHWLASRVERSHAAVLRVAGLLDGAAMERRRGLSISLARETLARAGLLPGPPLNLAPIEEP